MKSGNNQNTKEKATIGVPQKNAGVHGLSNSYLQAFKTGSYSQPVVEDTKPALVLDDSCTQKCDFFLSPVGKLKEFGSLPNLKLLLEEEGFVDITIHNLTDSDDEYVDVKNDGTQKNVNSEVDSEVDEIPETLFEQSEDGEIRSNAIKNYKDVPEDA
ncbi:hypothetical protein Tco_1433928 [Tanacetum coccineum]